MYIIDFKKTIGFSGVYNIKPCKSLSLCLFTIKNFDKVRSQMTLNRNPAAISKIFKISETFNDMIMDDKLSCFPAIQLKEIDHRVLCPPFTPI